MFRAAERFVSGGLEMTVIKTRKIAYFSTTTLLALGFLVGGALDIGQPPAVVQTMQHLGYPAYFAALIGVWKVSGALAIVAPGLPRLKEWAYAGMFFDLIGALVSHGAVGDGADKLAPPLVFLALGLASWALRPEGRRLPAARTEAVGERAPGFQWGHP
jgi:uncharacterized membrane protein YphA (DoxX/SURF4 family)